MFGYQKSSMKSSSASYLEKWNLYFESKMDLYRKDEKTGRDQKAYADAMKILTELNCEMQKDPTEFVKKYNLPVDTIARECSNKMCDQAELSKRTTAADFFTSETQERLQQKLYSRSAWRAYRHSM